MDAVDASLREATRLYRERHPAGTAELELRLGRRADAVFSAGITRDIFEQLERDLAEAHELVGDASFVEIVDYFYTLPGGRNVRTRVAFDTTTMATTATHVSKETLHSAVVTRGDDWGDACRVEVAVEHPVPTPPQSTLVNYVRVKQRRCFVDRRGGHEVWRYELSKTWSGPTRDAVEHSQHHCEPCYEVECELVDAGGAYLAERDDDLVARSLRMKMQMLLGDETSPLDLVVARAAKRRRR